MKGILQFGPDTCNLCEKKIKSSLLPVNDLLFQHKPRRVLYTSLRETIMLELEHDEIVPGLMEHIILNSNLGQTTVEGRIILI